MQTATLSIHVTQPHYMSFSTKLDTIRGIVVTQNLQKNTKDDSYKDITHAIPVLKAAIKKPNASHCGTVTS